MDHSPLILKIGIPSSPTTSNSNGSFEVALAQHDDETGALILGAICAGENGAPVIAVGVAFDSKMEMLGTKDVEKVKNVRDAWRVFQNESKVLWAIAAPIAFNIICLYGMNSTTQIFVGHVGNFELSAVAIGLAVVSNFSFGFLFSCRFSFFLFVLNFYICTPKLAKKALAM